MFDKLAAELRDYIKLSQWIPGKILSTIARENPMMAAKYSPAATSAFKRIVDWVGQAPKGTEAQKWQMLRQAYANPAYSARTFTNAPATHNMMGMFAGGAALPGYGAKFAAENTMALASALTKAPAGKGAVNALQQQQVNPIELPKTTVMNAKQPRPQKAGY